MTRRRWGVVALLGLALVMTRVGAGAQTLSYLKGQSISPAFEGWEQNPDGSFNMLFGYMNRNWEEEIDVPIGPNNNISPGDADQGQPTHFYPRRNRFVFKVKVPKDWGNKEVVWTLTANGKTEKAYGTLKPDYVVDAGVRAANYGAGGQLGTTPQLIGNQGPTLQIQGELKRRVKVGEPVSLTAIAKDDGKPNVKSASGSPGGVRTLPDSATGLRLSWIKYRGTGEVTFDPPQFISWEDTRPGANSPWSPGWKVPPVPKDNTWDVRATFKTPGEYVLRCIAHDGALTALQNVTVVVTP